ncbi:hypothetical protein ABC304_02145 [Microbacterium sp. 1P10UB]|uniref:hypothetical protein n=1 Tax=unclassified Microbacterium TaxID=2609290 RepID=UPI0039A10A3E
MSSTQALVPGSRVRAAAGEGPTTLPGRIEVRDKVVKKLLQHVAATVVGVESGRIDVSAAEHRDGIAVRITTPLPIPPLDDPAAVAAAGSVTDVAARIQHDVQDQLGRILGQQVTRVDVTVDGATTATTRRRVR